jgi:predicted CXXCH cytochrome family protein
MSHPVGFELADDGQLWPGLFVEPPATNDPAVQLVHDRIECSTCHTAHNPAMDEVVKKFLVRSNQNGAICLACHDPTREPPNRLAGWEVSAHAESPREVPEQEFFGLYDTVSLNACGNCHLSHGAAGSLLLVKAEENVCGLCHGGSNLSPPLPDVMGELEKAYAHPVTAETGVHEADEEAFPLTGARHAECADCHQPHASLALTGERTPPLLPGALNGTSGFDGEAPIFPARNEYQVCFKCHADSPNKPQADPTYSVFGHAAQRQAERDAADPKNLRHKFNSTISRHNVTQPGRLSEWEIPSLREAIRYPDGSVGRTLEVGSYIYCSDCHSSDEASRVGGRAPNGPHGSDYPHILTARYEQEYPPYRAGGSEGEGVTFTPGPTGAYTLCSLCHDVESSILQDESFTEHRSHVVDERTACSTCHDPHGIQDPGGNLVNNHRLVSFDLTIVGPDSMGRLYLESEAQECYLACHGVEHSPAQY